MIDQPVLSKAVYLSLVVPCYDEETALPQFYADAIGICESINKPFELIFIDDGSKDATLKILRQIAHNDIRVHYISFSRNFGKEAAMLAGLQAAQGTYTVVLDADGQDPPALIPQMLEAVASGEYDCAGTRRVNRTGEPPVRSFFARCFYRIMRKFTDIAIVDGARDFRLMNKRYMDALLTLPERNRFSKGIFPWIGFNTKWFEYENIARTAGSTKWSFWKLVMYSLDGMAAFSSKPIAIVSVLGMVLFMVALAIIVFIIIRKLAYGDPVAGWTSTICIILFCSGIQLFTIGILGQYIAKTYTETKQRPHFIIREAQ
ncbi:MAG: glycosyltransferase [Spirochaetaceae bacterium]|nr:glycosyltransferase [Spirochaetaceae bacterium]